MAGLSATRESGLTRGKHVNHRRRKMLILDFTGQHDSRACKLGANGGPCEMCKWANEVEDRRRKRYARR